MRSCSKSAPRWPSRAPASGPRRTARRRPSTAVRPCTCPRLHAPCARPTRTPHVHAFVTNQRRLSLTHPCAPDLTSRAASQACTRSSGRRSVRRRSERTSAPCSPIMRTSWRASRTGGCAPNLRLAPQAQSLATCLAPYLAPTSARTLVFYPPPPFAQVYGSDGAPCASQRTLYLLQKTAVRPGPPSSTLSPHRP